MFHVCAFEALWHQPQTICQFMQDVCGPIEKHAGLLHRDLQYQYKFKHCAVCVLLLSALYSNSKPQRGYAMEQGNAAPARVHLSFRMLMG